MYVYTYTINEQNLKLGVTWHASYGLWLDPEIKQNPAARGSVL